MLVDATSSSHKNVSKPAESGLNVMRGFYNNGNACYANAAIQCLLNMNCVKDTVLKSRDCALKRVFRRYCIQSKSGDLLDLTELRGDIFPNDLNQQDTSDFTHDVIEKNSDHLKDLFRFNQITSTKCSNPRCNDLKQQKERNILYFLRIPHLDNKSCSMANLLKFNIDANKQWQPILESKCSQCYTNSHLVTQTIVENPQQILIFVLQLLDDNQMKNTNLKLQEIRSDIEICNKNYVFSGAVFHHGPRLTEGHYTAIVKKGTQFYKADDVNLSVCKRWPNNSKDIYMLFYEEKK
uniref:Ubiquitin carboxyl-terminal hydrolase 17-like protein D n=1 Tax=Diabrotica virgifera virgifera TaxID=50390 RepID=A0A6P7FBK3_DIAVI